MSLVNHGNKMQSSFNSLIIVLAADGGWPSAPNFILVSLYAAFRDEMGNQGPTIGNVQLISQNDLSFNKSQ